MQAKVAWLERQGPPEVMSLIEQELPEPGAGEVLVEQTAIGLNYMDVYQRSGHYPLSLPSALGLEAAGHVLATGSEVTEFSPGDRVAYAGGTPGPGAYAGRRIVPAARLVPVPDAVSDEVAAAILLKGMTAEYLLNRAYAVQAGQFVLFHAASGGVGQLAGQWGNHIGAKMIGVAGGPEKCAAAVANGYAHTIDRKTDNIAARVRELTDDAGVDVVYDSVGKDSFEASLESLAPRGMFVSFGSTTGKPPPVEAATLQHKGSLYFTRPTLVTYTGSRADLLASAKTVFDLVAAGVLKVNINQRYALTDIVAAHRDLEGGHTTGSSIILP